ncbi:MAG: hypothetical protein ACKV2Q_17825 [Planctomycetaceae bacterium]
MLVDFGLRKSALIHEQVQQTPELFPAGISAGFRLTGRLAESAKLPGIRLRQLRVKNGVADEHHADWCGEKGYLSMTAILCYLHGFLKIRDRCRKAFALHKRI